jgi:hypothetical protein
MMDLRHRERPSQIERGALCSPPSRTLTPTLELVMPAPPDVGVKGRHCVKVRRHPVVAIVPYEDAAQPRVLKAHRLMTPPTHLLAQLGQLRLALLP